jgi:hypothetical protein
VSAVVPVVKGIVVGRRRRNKVCIKRWRGRLRPLALLSGDVIKKMNAKRKRSCPKVGLIRAEKEGAHGDQKDQ